jgi:hypothetical protein
MKTAKLAVLVLLLVAVSSSCKLLTRTTSRDKGPAIDFITAGKPLNVTVQLDKQQTASKLVPRTGGSVSLTATDGRMYAIRWRHVQDHLRRRGLGSFRIHRKRYWNLRAVL